MNFSSLLSARILRSIFIFLFIVSTIVVYSRMSGITGATNLNGNGCTCHGASSTDVTVEIIGPDEVEAGQTADYTVRITGGPAVTAGTNIATSGGEIDPVSTTLRKQGGELTHSSPVSFSGSSVDFVFSLTTPEEPGELTLYAAGNSTNNNSSTGGDAWNHAPDKVITLSEASGLIASHDRNQPTVFTLYQNYPNPFNPETQIPFSMSQSGYVSLKVYDGMGKEVAVLLSESKPAGTHKVSFDAGELTSGTYYYTLSGDGRTVTRKMLLLK